MEIRTGSVFFPPLRGTGPRETRSSPFVFPRNILRGVAALTGYSVGFQGDDHEWGKLEIETQIEIDQNTATVRIVYGLRDWSGSWDDDYQGAVNFIILVELESGTPPPGRLDLAVTGMEITQIIQSFHSAEHLDAPNVRPDNAIRLVERKPTVVRVYPAYSSDPAIPTPAMITGELVATSTLGGATVTLAPSAPIAPRGASLVQRSQNDHTLNFRLPEAICGGDVRLRVTLFDPADPGRRSPASERVARFIDRVPLRVTAVAIRATRPNPPIEAPGFAAVAGALAFTEQIYPVGEVLLSGYTVVESDSDLSTRDGVCSVLDVLEDMRGGSNDIYYGFLPDGIGSEVRGCGQSGLGTGFVGFTDTVAHEIGHAFGRNHVPCDSAMRCGSPENTDNSYPRYAGYSSDSIGEYGYDVLMGSVLDPATNFDIMGYSHISGNPRWISPYTYEALMQKFPPSSGVGGDAGVGGGDAEPSAGLRERLFLRLMIHRDRKAELHPSFHFPAPVPEAAGDPTPFTAVFVDDAGRELGCARLFVECHFCGKDCWPKRIRQSLPLPAGTRRLIVYEGEKIVLSEPFAPPDKPEVTVSRRGNDIMLQIAGEDEDVWFLVHYRDRRGAWRGVAPRTNERKIVVPIHLLAGINGLSLRVLATRRLGTSSVDIPVSVPASTAGVEIVQIASHPHRLRVAAVVSGEMVQYPDIAFFDDQGRELGRGVSLDLSTLPPQTTLVRAVALSAGGPPIQRNWVVRHTESGVELVDAPARRPPDKRRSEQGGS